MEAFSLITLQRRNRFVSVQTPGLFYPFVISSLILSRVMGNCSILTPAASNIALATTAPMVTIAGSPPPWGSAYLSSMITVSIAGNQEKRGVSRQQ
jgi:hypothetical protein